MFANLVSKVRSFFLVHTALFHSILFALLFLALVEVPGRLLGIGVGFAVYATAVVFFLVGAGYGREAAQEQAKLAKKKKVHLARAGLSRWGFWTWPKSQQADFYATLVAIALWLTVLARAFG